MSKSPSEIVRFAITALAAMLLACEGEPCVRESDCVGGNVCRIGHCVPVTDGGADAALDAGDGGGPRDAGGAIDSGADAGTGVDASADAASMDASAPDADAGQDAATVDTGLDAASVDADVDGG